MSDENKFPGGSVEELDPFYTVKKVPANSVMLMRTKSQAQNIPKGDIELVIDPDTGFITNRRFDADIIKYSQEYEETQGFSGTFNAFHRQLAADLIERYDLHDKDIVEIGCGKGEFLTLLCEYGSNRGVGFDPAYHPERITSPAKDRMTFFKEFFGEEHSHIRADFFCCKMTLEHIYDVAAFVKNVRKAVENSPGAIVFFQVPETQRILHDLAFWDIYHEHCSYFSATSLEHLFRSQGFEVMNLWTGYDDQYLMIEAQITNNRQLAPKSGTESILKEVEIFRKKIGIRLDNWRSMLQKAHEKNNKIVLWGGGSKAVAFLTTLSIQGEIECAVDINPHKHNTFLAGTGHPIVGPDVLTDLTPDTVIIMNPVYHNEIKQSLNERRLFPQIVHIDDDPSQIELA